MAERRDVKAVGISCAVFRRMLALYPKAHREEYGTAMLQLFRDQCRDAWSGRRVWGVAQFWLRASVDLLKASVLEHLSNLARRKSMLNLFRSESKLLSIFFSVFAAVFVLVVAGSTVITFLLPNTYASTATIFVERTDRSSLEDLYSSVQLEFEVIQSDAVLDKAIERLKLREIWGKKYARGQPLKSSQAVDMVKRQLQLERVRHTTFVKLRAFSDKPEGAARLANAVAEAYCEYRSEVIRQNPGAAVQTKANVIDPAVPNEIPVRPNKPLNIVLGVMVGTLMGILSGMAAAGVVWFVRWSGKQSIGKAAHLGEGPDA